MKEARLLGGLLHASIQAQKICHDDLDRRPRVAKTGEGMMSSLAALSQLSSEN